MFITASGLPTRRGNDELEIVHGSLVANHFLMIRFHLTPSMEPLV